MDSVFIDPRIMTLAHPNHYTGRGQNLSIKINFAWNDKRSSLFIPSLFLKYISLVNPNLSLILFLWKNPTLENKQIEIGHDKKPRVDAKEKFREREREREKRKNIKEKKDMNYTMSVGIFGQTSWGKKCY